jgi:hypothetical protein
LLQRLIKYLAQNVGSINSTNNISNYLRNEKTIEGNKNMLLGYRDTERGISLKILYSLSLLEEGLMYL